MMISQLYFRSTRHFFPLVLVFTLIILSKVKFISAQSKECKNDSSREERRVKAPPKCGDAMKECKEWAERGECENNPSYMLSNCLKSCDICRVTRG